MIGYTIATVDTRVSLNCDTTYYGIIQLKDGTFPPIFLSKSEAEVYISKIIRPVDPDDYDVVEVNIVSETPLL